MIYLLAIGSAALYGAADFTGGIASRRSGAIPVVLLSQASGLVLLALVLPFLPSASPARSDMLWGAAAGLIGGIGVALLYRALAIGIMAVVAPTTAICAVAIPVVISMLLGERPVRLALLGIALGIVSILLVSRQNAAPQSERGEASSPRSGSGVGIALVSGVAIGFFFLSLARTSPDSGMWPLLAARAVAVALFVAVAIAGAHSLRMPSGVVALAFGCGAIDTLANAMYVLAARQGPLSVVVTLSSLYPASTVLLARVVLGERLSSWQVTGVGCALAAIMLIVSSSG